MAKKETTPKTADTAETAEVVAESEVGEVADEKTEIQPGWVESLDEASLFDSPDASQQIKEEEAEVEPKKKVETKETTPAEEESSEEEIEGSDGVKRPRFAHFQREMQLAQNENKEIKAKLEQLEKSKAIGDYVLSNKELLAAVDRSTKGLPIAGVDNQIPEKPNPPSKPAGFSRQDALDDSEGLSAAYLAQLEEYPVKLEIWRVADEKNRAREAETINREQAEVQFASEFKTAIRNSAVADGRIPSDKVDEVVNGCIEFYSNPGERSPQEAVGLLFHAYLATLRPSKKETETKHKVDEIKEKSKGKTPPVPSVAVAGNSETVIPTLSDDDYVKQMEGNLLG